MTSVCQATLPPNHLVLTAALVVIVLITPPLLNQLGQLRRRLRAERWFWAPPFQRASLGIWRI